jgi:hypothetical protein
LSVDFAGGRVDMMGVLVGAGRRGIEIDAWLCVVCIFCCFWLRWPLTVAINLGRCFQTRLAVRPGQVAKCPFWMAQIHVDGTGLPHAACRNCTSSK